MVEELTDRLGRSRRHHGGPKRRYWTRERILAAVHAWHEKHGEPPRAADWDPTRMGYLLAAAREKVAGWERRLALFDASNFPSRRTINEVFGSWNTMIEAAGLVPRLPGQVTRRGAEPSPLLAPIGHATRAMYEAEDAGDAEGLVVALRMLERTARDLRLRVEREGL